jgi:hypothetical protein
MKQKIIAASILIFSVLLMAKVTFATTTTPDYWHSNDYYDIELGGSGNAFIAGTISVESISNQNVTELMIEIPYNDVVIYKIASSGGYYYPPCFEGPCPMYNQQYYYEPTFLNYTTQTFTSSTVVKIQLPYTISKSQTSTVYMIFSTHQIAYPVFQGWEFNFMTPKDPKALIRNVAANIYVPQNMQIKGKAQFDIQYKPSYLASIASTEKASAVIESFPTYRPSSQYSAQNLAPGESFTVKGLYGKDFVLLYLQEIVAGVLILFVFVVLIKYVVLDRARRLFRRSESRQEGFRRRSEFSFLRALIAGGFSGFMFVVVYFMLMYFAQFMSSGYNYNVQLPMVMLFILLSFLLEGLALFGLPVYLAFTYNKKEGFAAAVISIFAAFIILLFLSALFQPAVFDGFRTQVLTPGI